MDCVKPVKSASTLPTSELIKVTARSIRAPSIRMVDSREFKCMGIARTELRKLENASAPKRMMIKFKRFNESFVAVVVGFHMFPGLSTHLNALHRIIQ